jgi:hypothetical protein
VQGQRPENRFDNPSPDLHFSSLPVRAQQLLGNGNCLVMAPLSMVACKPSAFPALSRRNIVRNEAPGSLIRWPTQLFAPVLASLLAIAPSSSIAAYYSFSYSANGVSTGGLLETNDVVSSGHYSVNQIIGYRNGIPISSLIAPGSYQNNDNFLFAASPLLTNGGISYVSGGSNYNFYFDDFGGACGSLGYKESTGATCVNDKPVALQVKPFDLTKAAYYYSYSANGVFATGVMTTTAALNGGHYSVIDITGSRNGIAIDSILASGAFENNDNFLFSNAPFLTNGGISYSSGAKPYNFYFDNFGGSCGSSVYKESAGGTCGTDTTIALTILPLYLPVPEPSPRWMMLVSSVCLVFLRRRFGGAAI